MLISITSNFEVNLTSKFEVKISSKFEVVRWKLKFIYNQCCKL